MPLNMTFNESNKLIVTEETVNTLTGEIYIKGSWDGTPIEQTVPARPEGMVLFCFDEDSLNFYWQRLVSEDARANFKVIKSFGV